MRNAILPLLCFATLTATAANTEGLRAQFGRSVLFVENTLLIAEPSGFHEPGQVHVVRQNGAEGWNIVQSIVAHEGFVGDRFGSAVAGDGDLLAISSPAMAGGAGLVFVFRRGPDGRYLPEATLSAPTSDERPGFGAAVAIVGNSVLVGAPRQSNRSGAVHAFVANAGEWLPVATLTPGGDTKGFGARIASDGNRIAVGADGLVAIHRWNGVEFSALGTVSSATEDPDRFGFSLALHGDRLAVGAPARDGKGAVDVFFYDGGEWHPEIFLSAPESLGDRAMFGNAVGLSDDTILVGAPRDGSGVIVQMTAGDVSLISDHGLSGRAGFGGSFAASGDFLVAGASGDAYGEGTVVFLQREEAGWSVIGTLDNELELPPAISGREVECEDGSAEGYGCEGVDLLAFLPSTAMEINRGSRLNDVWGWTDPETGREYALVGHMEAMAVVEVSNPTGPVYLGTLPRTEGSPGSTWRDIKVYRDHAFVVADGAGQHGMQVFDLTQLRDVENPPVQFEPDFLYDRIASAHNIVINEETGFAYAVGNGSGGETCGGGLHMIDIRDPKNPSFAGCFTHQGTNNSGGGATHDAQCVIYQGPDSDHTGKEICISSNGAALSIADVTNKDETIPLSSASYPNYAYVHQGWFTDDQRYFYQNDEGDEISGVVDRTRTLIWDMTDLDDPEMIGEFYGPTNATDHNLYVDGNLMYQTNNSSGLRVIDISDPESPVEVGHFDTTPYGNDKAGFNGTWSSYPYFKSGTLVVTSRREGLFLVRKRTIDT